MRWGARERARQAVTAVYDVEAAEALRRDIAGALTRRVAPGVYQPGGILMRGKAAKHFRLLGRTLLVRADPVVAADVVSAAVLSAQPRFRPLADLEPGEIVALAPDSMFGEVPRFAVRTSPLLPGVTEVGTLRFMMRLRFPQGGPFTDRAATAALDGLRAAGLPVTEERRRFAPETGLPPGADGPWAAGDLLGPGDE